MQIVRVSLGLAFLSIRAVVAMPGTLGDNGDGQEETHDAAANR